jgi:pimeloyl-ACP methyl ester carboxylesterase
LKRITLVSAVILPAAIATAYYSLPHLFKEPLVALNRTMSGLTEKTVTLDAHEIHYLEGGDGEPVVLLHGIFAEKDHWVDFSRQLTGGYRIVVPDLPGFGESSRLAGQRYDYATQTERLKNLLDALGIQRAHLAGNSMGGTIAALFAIRYPERVASVALIGAPHGVRSPQPSKMDRLIDAGKSPLVASTPDEFDEMMSLVFSKRPFLPYPILNDARNGAIRNAESNLRLWRDQLKDRHMLHERIGELHVRTLALWGSNDQVFDASGADVLRSKVKDADVRVVHGIGHLPMMEAPKDMSMIYAGFLRTAP